MATRGNWFLLVLNPEPWTAPESSIGRRGDKLVVNVHKNEQLRAFQEAVRETLLEDYPTVQPFTGLLELEFYLWRVLPEYATESGRSHRKHQADATNLQKALEDALQGVLFDNDRDVVSIKTTIMEQTASTDAMILVGVHEHKFHPHWPRDKAIHMRRMKETNKPSSLVRYEDDGLF